MTPDPNEQPQFYAGIPIKRLLAWCVDMVIIVILSLLVLPLTAFVAAAFFPAFILAVGLLYRWATIARGSSTLGMRLLACEFRDIDDLPLSSNTALAHSMAHTVCIAMPLLQIISIILMLSSARRQGLPDMLLGTVALNRRV